MGCYATVYWFWVVRIPYRCLPLVYPPACYGVINFGAYVQFYYFIPKYSVGMPFGRLTCGVGGLGFAQLRIKRNYIGGP